ncbi:Hypothetical protein FKW44_023512 [Caligus rogercresseyi]|uniref:Uncharacterized protein n=1 Tax=Caligus rogercresseyi TaxID=217165 RepID=A0A7T8GP48_CALRO|nr:Hypothetical protein FKW44_023512 [Caligus rogercresseyi]
MDGNCDERLLHWENKKLREGLSPSQPPLSSWPSYQRRSPSLLQGPERSQGPSKG